jgi:rhamnosyltransferase subunit B
MERSMDLLLVTLGSAGDVHPVLGIGRALKARGHAVSLVAGERFAHFAASEGLGFIGLPNPKTLPEPPAGRTGLAARLGRLALAPFVRGWAKLARASTLAPMIRPVYEAVAARFVPGRTAIIATAPALGARLAHERLGVPLATLHYYPALVRSPARPPVTPGFALARRLPRFLRPAAYRLLDRLGTDPPLAGPLNRLRAELGLAPVSGVLGPWRDSPELILGLYPDWFGAPQPDWPARLRPTGFPLYDDRAADMPAEVTAFLDAGPPPIVFSPGTDPKSVRPDFFFQAVAACRRLGRRGLLLTRSPERVPADLPGTVCHATYAPLGRFLHRAAAIVHHGGVGTTGQALAAGLPQLIVPQRHDQPDNAARLARLGVARVLTPGAFRARAVARHLGAMLGDASMNERCRELARRMHDARPVEEACRILEEWLERRRHVRAAA